MIVEIPVYFSDQVRPVRCEIQIRTIAMDFWATLDHDMPSSATIWALS